MSNEVNKLGHQGDLGIFRGTDKDFYSNEDFEAILKSGEYSSVPLDKYGALTLIEGEATGHHHVISNPKAVDVIQLKSPSQSKIGFDDAAKADVMKLFLIRVKEPVEIQHIDVLKDGKPLTNEHGTALLKPGIYEARSQVSIRPSSNTDLNARYKRVVD